MQVASNHEGHRSQAQVFQLAQPHRSTGRRISGWTSCSPIAAWLVCCIWCASGDRLSTTSRRSAFYVRADCAAIHLAVTCWITEMKRAVVIPNIIRPLAA